MIIRFLKHGFALAACLATVAPAAAETVNLLAQPAIGMKQEAFPRLEATDTASQRINQALRNADARLLTAATECRADARESQADPKDAGWQREVAVAMRGAGYIALVAADTWYCGGPYPNAAAFALAYDLRTGAPLNWERVLPKALVQGVSLDTAGDGTRLGVVASPALKLLYLKILKPDADCSSALRESELQFMLWPDARREGVAIQPSGLPHAIAACGTDVVIPLATLHTLGVDRGLLDAIAAGHRAGLYGPPR
jgi:hypothetical protein